MIPTKRGVQLKLIPTVIISLDKDCGATVVQIVKKKDWKMVTKIAGMIATWKRANAIGVVLMAGVVEKIGLEMDVMELLGDLVIIYVFCNKTENWLYT